MVFNKLKRRQCKTCERTFKHRPWNECLYSGIDIRYPKKSCLQNLQMWKVSFVADDCKLHYDNAPATTAKVHHQLSGQSKGPNDSPAILQSGRGFDMFPSLKGSVHGLHFGKTGEIQEACTAALNTIPEKAYRDAFDSWKWRRCIDAGGEYFETFQYDMIMNI